MEMFPECWTTQESKHPQGLEQWAEYYRLAQEDGMWGKRPETLLQGTFKRQSCKYCLTFSPPFLCLLTFTSASPGFAV